MIIHFSQPVGQTKRQLTDYARGMKRKRERKRHAKSEKNVSAPAPEREKKSSAGIACSINAGGRDSVALAPAKRRHLSTLKRCHPMCHLPSPDNSDRRHHHALQPRCADQVVLSPTSYLRTSGGFRHCSCAQSLVSPTKPLGTCLHAFEKR